MPWVKFHLRLAEVAENAITNSDATEPAQALAQRIVDVSFVSCFSNFEIRCLYLET